MFTVGHIELGSSMGVWTVSFVLIEQGPILCLFQSYSSLIESLVPVKQ